MPAVSQSIQIVKAERDGTCAWRERNVRTVAEPWVAVYIVLRIGDVGYGMPVGVEHVPVGLAPVAAFAYTHTYCMPAVSQCVKVVQAERDGTCAWRERNIRTFAQSRVCVDIILRIGDVRYGMTVGVEHVPIGLAPVAAFAYTHTYCMPAVGQRIEVVKAEGNRVAARREGDRRAFIQSGVIINVVLCSSDVSHGILLGVEHVAVGL